MQRSHTLPLQFILPCCKPLPSCHLYRHGYPTAKYTTSPTDPATNARQKSKPSLFNELFPDEEEPPPKPQPIRETHFEKLPPFRWLGQEEPLLRKITQKEDETPTKPKFENVLALHGLSKTLEKSDFVRLSPKGKHIEGWTHGLVEIIQARNEVTLEPLGSYYVIFSSEKALRAYNSALQRLHTLSKLQNRAATTGYHIPPPRHLVAELEDPDTSIQAFTLLPAHDRRIMTKLKEPFEPGVPRLLENRMPSALSSLKDKAGQIVMVTAEGGFIDELELREALAADGKRRNLLWRLVGTNRGIKKISGSRSLNSDQGKGDMETEGIPGRAKYAFPIPSKYVLKFEDGGEARRFVREWHRRMFPRRGTLYPGDDEPPIINAELIW